MSLIRLLPENLINQIAAGEVVERPSSVVKELLENSIDANAGNISVEIKDGGKTFIKVSDDGNGMSEDDLELSYLRHATSKISDENDLWNIRSLGFRGEALASIASVSKMMIKSKRESDLSGITVFLEGGEKISKEKVGMPKGTQIEVYNLFFNTPARQKYLKKESTEIGAISYQIISIALANPFISFNPASLSIEFMSFDIFCPGSVRTRVFSVSLP